VAATPVGARQARLSAALAASDYDAPARQMAALALLSGRASAAKHLIERVTAPVKADVPADAADKAVGAVSAPGRRGVAGHSGSLALHYSLAMPADLGLTAPLLSTELLTRDLSPQRMGDVLGLLLLHATQALGRQAYATYRYIDGVGADADALAMRALLAEAGTAVWHGLIGGVCQVAAGATPAAEAAGCFSLVVVADYKPPPEEVVGELPGSAWPDASQPACDSRRVAWCEAVGAVMAAAGYDVAHTDVSASSLGGGASANGAAMDEDEGRFFTLAPLSTDATIAHGHLAALLVIPRNDGPTRDALARELGRAEQVVREGLCGVPM